MNNPHAGATALRPQTMKVLSAILVLVISGAVMAQEEPPPEDRSDSYKSLRGTIYRKSLTEMEEHGYDGNFKLRLTTAIYKYRTISDIFDEEIEHFNSVGLRPTISFEIPTPWENIRFIPESTIQYTRRFDIEQDLLSGSASAKLDYKDRKEEALLGAFTVLEYATRYDVDGLNLSDYLKLQIGGSLEQGLGWQIGEHAQSMKPYASVSYYLNDLVLGQSEDDFVEIDTEYEVGVEFGSEPRMYLWKLRIPKLRIIFTYSEETRGVKIRF